MFRPQARYFTVCKSFRAVSGPCALAAFPSREEGRSSAGDCRAWPIRVLGPIPELRRLGKYASEQHPWVTGVEHTPRQPVLRAESRRGIVPWQIIGPVRRAPILSGFSLRNKSIESCAKG